MTTSAAASYILFTVAGTTYGICSDDVRHMEMLDEITPVPNANAYLDGVVFSRGQIVPVLNLRARFGFDRVAHDTRTRLIVVQSGERWVGLVVDSAREFIRIPDSAIQPPSQSLANLSANYLEGLATMGDRLVLILNVDAVLDTSLVAGAPVLDTARTDGAGGLESRT